MNFELLKKITQTPAAPGYEQELTDFLKSHFESRDIPTHIDSMGNLTVTLGEGEPTVMSAAHVDEISLISTHIEKDGFIRFSTLGGFDPRTLYTQAVTVLSKEGAIPGVIGGMPAHILSDEEKKQAPKIENLYIDTGLPAEKVKEIVPTGTLIVRDRPLQQMGDCITSKSLDNRISVYMLAEAVLSLSKEKLPCTFNAVFTVQEEVGIRGARVAAQRLRPDIGIALDITLAADNPGVEESRWVTRPGKGTAIKIMDSSVISTHSLVSYMIEIVEKNEITFQREVLTAGGTDTSGMQYLAGLGSHVTCISTPTRYVHSAVELCDINDVEQGILLLQHAIRKIDRYQPDG